LGGVLAGGAAAVPASRLAAHLGGELPQLHGEIIPGIRAAVVADQIQERLRPA
jgi:hypothetical protein